MKNNNTNIIVPLQGKKRNGKTDFIEIPRDEVTNIQAGKIYYFAYMRRSTTKYEQKESLPQQEEGIKSIAKSVDIPLSEIRSYTESKSGFENRTRDEWRRMLSDIDRVSRDGGKCILLCRDSSRLSRNLADNIEISNRLFGDNQFKNKKFIEKIYMLGDGTDVVEWNNKTDKEALTTELHNNYINSLVTKKKSITGILLKLEGGEFPYTSPYGLSRVIDTGEEYKKSIHKGKKTVLKQTEVMSCIYKIFVMKTEGKVAKDMSAFLKKYAGVCIPPKKIVETIIQNTLYKGEYTEKTKGRFFDNIRFFEGKPPIDKSLWDRANATIGTRGNGYGKGQMEHLLLGRIKTEQGNTFQLYTAKGKSGIGKHFNYKSISRNEKGEIINVYISETNILNYVVREILNVSKAILKRVYSSEIIEALNGYDKYNVLFASNEEEYLDIYKKKRQTDIVVNLETHSGILSELFRLDMKDIPRVAEEEAKYMFDTIQEIDPEMAWIAETEKEMQDRLRVRFFLREAVIIAAIKDSPFFQRLGEELKWQKGELERLKKQQEEVKEELASVESKAYKLGYNKAFAIGQSQETQKRLDGIEEELAKISNNTLLEDILEKLPKILAKIVELSSGTIGEAKIKDSREDIRLILDIITVELQIDNKKELKIKLFEGLEDLLDDENGNWSHHRDLNPRPFPYHGNALPTELWRQYLYNKLGHYMI